MLQIASQMLQQCRNGGGRMPRNPRPDQIGTGGRITPEYAHRVATTPVQFIEKPVCIECLIGEQRIKFVAFDQFGDTDDIVALTGHQYEIDEGPQSIGQRKDFTFHNLV